MDHSGHVWYTEHCALLGTGFVSRPTACFSIRIIVLKLACRGGKGLFGSDGLGLGNHTPLSGGSRNQHILAEAISRPNEQLDPENRKQIGE